MGNANSSVVQVYATRNQLYEGLPKIFEQTSLQCSKSILTCPVLSDCGSVLMPTVNVCEVK